MYATVRRYEGMPDPTESGRIIRERFVPLMTEIDGFVAYYWVDAGDGVMVSTTVFQDQAGADASNERLPPSFGTKSWAICGPTPLR